MKSGQRVRKSATIRDVARLAGVSLTTVSNVLNGRTDAMTDETLRRVQDAILTLGYRRNMAARGLVMRRSATIGLILAEIETPLFLQALPHMEPLARAAGYNLLVCIARNIEDEQQAIDLLLEKQADGIIFFSSSDYRDHAHLLTLHRLGVPVVLINRANRPVEFAAINWDQTTGIAYTVGYLVGLGHRRIAHLLGPASRKSTDERLAGYRQGLRDNGLEFREDYLRPGDFTALPDMWRQSTRELLELDPRPTAIIASDDVVASMVLATAQDCGLRVPEDVAVIGIDDQPFCTYLRPALTSLRLPTVQAGELAMQMILGMVSGQQSPVEHIVLPCPLVVRASCGAANGAVSAMRDGRA